jgi:glycogen synthase
MDKSSRKKHQGEHTTAPKTPAAGETPRQVIGRFVAPTAPAPSTNGSTPHAAEKSVTPTSTSTPRSKATIAIFCQEPPDQTVGQHLQQTITAMAGRGTTVHLFTRLPFALNHSGVTVHTIGGSETGDAIARAEEFADRATATFGKQFPGSVPVSVIGCEWATIPALTRLHETRKIRPLLSLHSLERQRSDMLGELSRRIEAMEAAGLRLAKHVLVHDAPAEAAARGVMPECGPHLSVAQMPFPKEKFQLELDAGQVKARHQIGPVDPTILFVGDLSERYGPDLAVKAMPAVLRHFPQARLAVVGDGSMFWPLRVYARYLLLEHAVRMIGSLESDPMFELVRACDLMVVPSRESTPWWPILAAWAAGKPVVASHQSATGLLEHQVDSLLIYPSENSCVWGIERVLYDPKMAAELAEHGEKKLDEHFGWDTLAAQVEDLASVGVGAN